MIFGIVAKKGFPDPLVDLPVIEPGNATTPTPGDPVTISYTTPGVEIYYTTDGTQPNRNSHLYSGSFPFVSGTDVIMSIAYGGDWASPVASARYTNAWTKVAEIPDGGGFSGRAMTVFNDEIVVGGGYSGGWGGLWYWDEVSPTYTQYFTNSTFGYVMLTYDDNLWWINRSIQKWDGIASNWFIYSPTSFVNASGAAFYNGKIYSLPYTGQLYEWEIGSGSWTYRAAKPSGEPNATGDYTYSMVVHNGSLYRCRFNSSRLHKWTTGGTAWEDAVPEISPSAKGTALMHSDYDNKIYAFIRDETGPDSGLYSSDGTSWVKVSAMTQGLDIAYMLNYESSIYGITDWGLLYEHLEGSSTVRHIASPFDGGITRSISGFEFKDGRLFYFSGSYGWIRLWRY